MTYLSLNSKESKGRSAVVLMSMALRLLRLPSTLSGDQHSATKSTLQRCQTKFPPSLFFSTFSISPFSDILPLTASTRSRSRRRSSLIVFHVSSSAIQEQISSSPTIITETGADVETRTRLIAQNVPWTCTSEDIRNMFQKYGTVIDVELSMYDKTRNRGLAFITMGSPEEAVAALTNLDTYEFEGRTIKVDYSRSLKKKASERPEPVVKYNVFIGNLSQKVRSRDLREFFSSGSCNLVSGEVIFKSNPRRPTGYGFVSFGSKEEAEATVSAFNGQKLMGRPVRLALSKESLKRGLEEASQAEETSTQEKGDGGVPDTVEER